MITITKAGYSVDLSVKPSHEGVKSAGLFGIQHGFATSRAKIAVDGGRGGGFAFVGVGRVAGVVYQLGCAAGRAFHIAHAQLVMSAANGFTIRVPAKLSPTFMSSL